MGVIAMAATYGTEPIDTWDVILDDIIYVVAVFPIRDQFAADWQCPACEQKQLCLHNAPTHVDALDFAEEDVRAHHAKCHRRDRR
jgi:hypothetical protein